MRSPRLMLVLILGGLGLMFAGLTRMDLNHQAGTISAPASIASSWLMGLAGALMVCAGVYLVRAAYLRNGKAAIAGSPGRQRLLWVLGVVGVLAVAGMLVLSRQHGKSHTPGSVFHPGAAGPESSGATSAQLTLPPADEQMKAKLQPVIHCVNEATLLKNSGRDPVESASRSASHATSTFKTNLGKRRHGFFASASKGDQLDWQGTTWLDRRTNSTIITSRQTPSRQPCFS